ncbi:MAG: DUF2339 domain-containing protein [Calditrichales bacterium]|nr:MAG: DUF2339 domain-containing protein [Calditrichales bacterium]
MSTSLDNTPNESIRSLLEKLNQRVTAIEKELNIPPLTSNATKPETPAAMSASPESSDEMELKIGEFWFAKVGIVMLAIGIAFLLIFPFEDIPTFVPVLFGYGLVAGLALVSHMWRNSYNLISRYLMGGGLLLLYFTTLRLHFFSPVPLIESDLFELSLLIAVVSINLFISLRRNSVYLTGITLMLGFLTALVGENPLTIFTLTLVLALMVSMIQHKYNWPYLLHVGMILTGLTHLLWFLNNPVIGNQIVLASAPDYNIYFMMLYMIIYNVAIYFMPAVTEEEKTITNTAAFFNSFGFYMLFLMVTLMKFKEMLTLDHLVISIILLGFSFLSWKNKKSKLTISFYAINAYAALSVAILSFISIPESFILLCWQSLLVISTAILFRSRFIVVANFIIFVLIFMSYLIMTGSTSMVSVSFGVVALISARILNWRKKDLELQTEMMRMAYLVSAFIIIPYALYHSLPGGYVSVSWAGLAGLYFLLSIILDNNKYRWMALLTLILAAFHLVIIGTTNLSPVFRLLSFIVLGTAMLIVSLQYTKVRRKQTVNKKVQD